MGLRRRFVDQANAACLGPGIDLCSGGCRIPQIRQEPGAPDTDAWVPFQLDPASENFGSHRIQGDRRVSGRRARPTGAPDRSVGLLLRTAAVAGARSAVRRPRQGRAPLPPVTRRRPATRRQVLTPLLGATGAARSGTRRAGVGYVVNTCEHGNAALTRASFGAGATRAPGRSGPWT